MYQYNIGFEYEEGEVIDCNFQIFDFDPYLSNSKADTSNFNHSLEELEIQLLT